MHSGSHIFHQILLLTQGKTLLIFQDHTCRSKVKVTDGTVAELANLGQKVNSQKVIKNSLGIQDIYSVSEDC